MKSRILYTVLLIAALGGLRSYADDALPDGAEIVRTQKERNHVETEYSRYEMTLIDRRGKESQRTMTVSVRDTDSTKMILKFLQPNDIRNVGLLTWGEATEDGEEGSDDSTSQWMYLPSLKRVKRIAGGSKKSLFMGTDLAYEDFHAENLATHTYTTLGVVTQDGVECWKVEAKPSTDKEKADSGYGRRVLVIRKDDYVTMYAEMFDHHDKLIKTVVYGDYVKVKGEAMRPNRLVYTRPMQKTSTVMVLAERKVDLDLPDSRFSQQELKRPPVD